MSAVHIPILEWQQLNALERSAALERPLAEESVHLRESVSRIIAAVRAEGDTALARLTLELDGASPESPEVSADEFKRALTVLTPTQHAALERAIANVRRFHEAQRTSSLTVETSPGVRCERFEVPIESVGLYVPAGTAPLPSTAVMLAVPAQIAGCPTRIVCTPPRRDGSADPAVLVAARLCGIERVFKIGGAQAVAAMAFGTQTVPKVDKIFGPGNAWVTAAKDLVASLAGGAARDLPAGPSEVLVIADEDARADFVAADLLAQAEHSIDAQVLLVTTSHGLARATQLEIAQQCRRLSRRSIIEAALRSARIIRVEDLEAAFAVSNAYAPEHLIISVANARSWLARVRNAGSVFLGNWTPEPLGDYCSGTNHVLPTGGHARALSGLALADFSKRITVQELTTAGLQDLGPVAETLAHLETLDAHANAVAVRLKSLAADPRQ
ncbi:MAG TPA: histidinol dehydrogenase [Steroidobacteraceae bacterium]|nr:histidinol dehydrogenase [Steroidobacteraceae bacterium]